MPSYNLLQPTRTRFESPAKVFAKLKSKVQSETWCAKERDEPLFSIKEKHGGDFHSPRKKSASMRTVDESKKNKMFSSNRNEAQALTLSPISPENPCTYSCKPLQETSPDMLPRYTRRDATFLESTSVSQAPSAVNIDQISRKPQISDSNNFIKSIRTPAKTQPVENNGRGVFDKRVAHLNPVSLNSVVSPMRNRLRKRKLDQQKCHNASKPTGESIEDVYAPQERRQSPSTEDYTLNNTCMQGFGHVTGSADQSEMIHEPMFPRSRLTLNNSCNVIVEKIPTMSPAKMFVYMKARESKRGKEVHNSSRRELFENLHQPIGTSLPTAHNMDEMEEAALNDSPEVVVPVNDYGEDSADKPLDADGSEDVLIPAAPILLEDSLVLNSPRVSIPKKDKAVFQRNHGRNQEKFPVDSVIHLKKWFLRRNQKGLFVDGIHRDDNIPWNSNIIVDRVSKSVLKTISGRVYILVGKMNMYHASASDFPNSFLKKFVYGFPPNWKNLYETFLSESKDNKAKKYKEKVDTTKTDSKASANQSVKRQRQQSFRSPDSCTPASSTKVSRSGRVIKPPLEYWKGGRVILDAHMNVTIHECYDICNSSVSSVVSKKPVRVFQPNSDGLKKRGSAGEDVSLLRKVRSLRTRNRPEVNHDKVDSNLSEPASEALKIPEEQFRKTRSSQMRPHTRGTYVDRVPQKQSEPERQRSKKQMNDTKRPSIGTSSRKQKITNSPKLPPVTDKSSSCPSSEEFPSKRRRREKGVHSKKDLKVSNKSQLDPKLSSSKSSKEHREGLRNRSRRTRGNDKAKTKPEDGQWTDLFPPTQPKQTKLSTKRHKGNTVVPQERDENEWTELELIKLQEAVSFYPKNINGFWTKVARMVGTRSAEDCHQQHTSKGTSQSPAKRANKLKKEKAEAPKPPVAERPVISARAGTLKRKQQVRQFLEALPREDVDDAFSSTYMQNKRFEIPSTSLSDNDFSLSNLEPQTPMSSCFPEAKTPQCLHITPGMIGSPNANGDDKLVYQMQRRMKKNQFNVLKAGRSSMRFTPSANRKMPGCGNTVENDDFLVWEMFPENDGGLSDSEEQEDFYFSDD